MVARDLELLFLGVARQLEHLHAVPQRVGHRVEDVGRGDKQHLGQIERHIQVMVSEGVVLLRIEYFEEGRRRIAAKVRAELVDFIEDEYGVSDAGATEALDDLAGQRADVRAAVPADLRFVAHAAERHAHELAAERRRDRTRERGLADAGRPDETENRPLDRRVQLADREVLEDAVLRLLEPGVIRVEDLLRAHEVDRLVAALGPRQRREPVDVGARHRVLGGGRRHFFEAAELAHRLFLHILGHAGGVDPLAQLVELAGVILVVAQFLVDRFELLAEEVLALVLADFRLHLGLNLRSDLEDLELLDQEPMQHEQSIVNVGRFEQFLFDLGRERAEARRDEVGEAAGLGDVRCEAVQIVRKNGRELHDLLECRADVALQRVDFGRIFRLEERRRFGDGAAQVRLRGHDPIERDTRQPLHDQSQAAVRQFEHLVNMRERADGVKIRLRRVVDGRIPLREDADHRTGRDRVVDQLHRRFAGDRERHERIGKQDRVAQRQHG